MSSVELQSPPSGWLVWYGRLLEGVVMALMVILFLEVMIGVVFRMAGHSLSWYDEVASILNPLQATRGPSICRSDERSNI